MSRRLLLALTLVTAGPLVAQSGTPPPPPPPPPSRLAGRVPAAALPAIDSLIAVAVAESLPSEPLVQKALEGSAKNIPADRLVQGVRRGLLQLRQARILVGRAFPGTPPLEGHVAAVAAALARGLPSSIVERLLSAAPHEPPASALHAAADLIAHGFNADSATALLVAAHSQGLHGVRLLDVAVAADHELQRGGRTPAEALARVRERLPNVPAADAGAAVTRRGPNGSSKP